MLRRGIVQTSPTSESVLTRMLTSPFAINVRLNSMLSDDDNGDDDSDQKVPHGCVIYTCDYTIVAYVTMS